MVQTIRNKKSQIVFSSICISTVSLTLLLAGCASESSQSSSTSSHSSTSSATPKQKSVATTTPTPTSLVGEPTGYTCDTLLTLQELFDFNQNYYFDSSNKTGLGSTLSSSASSLKGITCVYSSQSDGAPIEITLAKIQTPGIDQVKADLSQSGKSTSVYGQEPSVVAYFVSSGDLGTINVLIGNFWLSAASSSFGAPEDAIKILSPVIAKLS